jgi:hypothetical protein
MSSIHTHPTIRQDMKSERLMKHKRRVGEWEGFRSIATRATPQRAGHPTSRCRKSQDLSTQPTTPHTRHFTKALTSAPIHSTLSHSQCCAPEAQGGGLLIRGRTRSRNVKGRQSTRCKVPHRVMHPKAHSNGIEKKKKQLQFVWS